MASRRISKSSIDWAKFSSVVPRKEAKNFTAFKARSDAYLTRVLSYPENPPQINFEEYRKKVSSKDAVNQLESAYKALKVTYPKDTLSQEVDKQEEEYKKKALAYVDVANAKIAEAEKLREKFEIMIPYRHMTAEDFFLTFPDWAPNTLEAPSIHPHYEKTPGLSKEERARLAAPLGRPYSI
ncbi:PREDICTED: ATP synthase subunit d, mitochondrial-like [Rhagoletis zephyria]|uniref:ATP synthase subunit d, mitochondrial-like n=1 Tax=Rhagoletis zephyria TaxID=28612 RepID=UPI0008118B56|nr:PREDICTED: ATP synthase subunit d, mitochondrial-like [Rhagoletis zephyria]KAH9390075.1 Atp5hp [Tyrophagus putrescentiae]